ncbi:tetratricopeptide repeat protein [Longimicrobium sp.]|uniref:tetratricopeptide repeat protein n=1 Tax=Longimicrobium sp. TaxID=2029185 RepID=UPI002D7F1873|nr:tetratricopeptide repeat protein [Longimicrobium sp.]
MPLASALREAGETGKAEELLRENLKRHPGYLSAHVLLGRCLADRGAQAEARNEFQYVLSVDPQNLIALRTLGDMSATGGDPAEARRWYGELLSVDPMNTEARQALAALEGVPQPAAPAPPPATEQDAFGMVEIDSGVSHAADHPAAHADPGTWGDLRLDEPALASPAPEAAPQPPAGNTFEALDFGAVDLDAASAGGALIDGPAADAPAPASGGFDAWGSVDDGQLDIDPSGVEPLPLESFGEAGMDAGLAPAEPHEEHDEHEEVVTETIAELYARQGFPDRAAGVYRELIARRGQEPALVRRLEELEREMAGGGESPIDEDAHGFGAIDLPLMGDDEPATASADESGSVDQQPGATSWLETVDAVVAGSHGAASEDAGSADVISEDVTADAGAADFSAIDLPAGLDLPSGETPEPAAAASNEDAFAAAEPTGDAFADSFANGFEGAEATAATESGRQEWAAPTVEESEAVPELASAAAFASTMEEAPAAEPSPAAGAAEEPAHGGHTISAYLTAILTWRPGAAAPASPKSPAAEAAFAAPPADDAPPAGRPWDEETLGAAEEQPPMDEPWIATGPAVADQPSEPDQVFTSAPAADADADEPWAVPAEEEAPSELEPWGLMPEQVPPGVDASAGADAEPQAEPWAAEETSAEEAEDLPWLGTGADEPEAGTEPAAPAQPSAGEEPMPWEAPFELSPEVPQEPSAERPAPRQEPTVEPAGGFSFEDFFAERPAEPEAAPVPEPAPPALPEPITAAPATPPAQPAPQQQAGGEEDEDLESFQAWLQSLKR